MINNFMLKIFVYLHLYIMGKSKNGFIGTLYNYVQACNKKKSYFSTKIYVPNKMGKNLTNNH